MESLDSPFEAFAFLWSRIHFLGRGTHAAYLDETINYGFPKHKIIQHQIES
jgi:hypothetical protein